MEILALRHQLAVVERTARRRPNLAPADRLFWVLLSGVLADWSSALLIVKESSPRPGRVVTVLQNELSFWYGHSRNCASRNQSEKPGQMVGTTRSRVNHFMNKFKKLGFIDYNGGLTTVHSGLLSVVLHD